MKKLSDFKDDINKCSKCGLCQAVCPVFKLTKNDCAVSRGKFVMLSGVLRGELNLSKNINKYLDMCSKCGKCESFCPSDIKVTQIFETTKYEYAKTNFVSKIVCFLESKFVFFNMLSVFDFFVRFFRRKYKVNKTINKKYLYFRGCADKVDVRVENAMYKILSQAGVVIEERNFDCCGVPFLSSGNLERFEQAKEHNKELLNGEYDGIITTCASCESTLKKYDVDIPIINVLDLISELDIKFVFKKPKRVTFHKPCHLEDIKSVYSILNRCENVEYVEMKDYDECCGFSGEFALKNPKISMQMMKNKAQNVLNTNTDYVLTLCPACIIGLNAGLVGKNNNPKVMNVIEFLSKSKIN